ncbi:unnamed protein product [Pleuronectes platessa]|uniref:Gamma-aminobutyric acid receptor-associated protein-like 2 n=1 Tax=Pleuronectes platessa TaxID=8262 RepID=A0A9N7YK13_PLEPL|nr:unnamed protein product [Pleuronectes platessa]
MSGLLLLYRLRPCCSTGSAPRLDVIVEKVSGSQIVDIDKRKYLVPSDITVAQFMWIIRKRIQLPSEKAIFLFVDKTVPQSRGGATPALSMNTRHTPVDLLSVETPEPQRVDLRNLTCFPQRHVPLVHHHLTMGQLYDKEKDEDGFLYVAYSGENTFGYNNFHTTRG